MRCDAHELAIIDKPAANGACKCFIGLPVVTENAYERNNGVTFWNVMPPLSTALCPHYKHVGPQLRGIADDMLRPIRDPRVGHDA